MNTNFALLARFETSTLPLDLVCDEFFGISVKTAKQKIKAQDFPVPTFRLIDSERAPLFIKVDDLSSHIDKCYQDSKVTWSKVNS